MFACRCSATSPSFGDCGPRAGPGNVSPRWRLLTSDGHAAVFVNIQVHDATPKRPRAHGPGERRRCPARAAAPPLSVRSRATRAAQAPPSAGSRNAMALSAAGRLTSRGARVGPLRLAVTTDSCQTISVGAARHLPNFGHGMALSTAFLAQRTRATRWAWFVHRAAPWSQSSDEGRVRQSGCTEWCGRRCRS
jgi:hypothetical protein